MPQEYLLSFFYVPLKVKVGDIEFSSKVSRLLCCLADLFASKNLFKKAGSVSFKASDVGVSNVSATNGAEINRQ